MCFSAIASFSIAAPLIAGGSWCVSKAIKDEPRYMALAIMPLIVGVQQFIEGIVWTEIGQGNALGAHSAAMFYLAVVWVFWPCWVPFMASSLEPNSQRKALQQKWAVIGFLFGFMLYAPYFYRPDWISPYVAGNCLAYNTVVLPDIIVPRPVTALAYLAIIGLVPLTSSHAAIRTFGGLLLLLVPMTYFFFVETYLSVLCFFAAIVTSYILLIIAKDKCGLNLAKTDERPVLSLARPGNSSNA